MRRMILLFGLAVSSASSAEDIADAVDRMLATSLTDPLSAIDYRVSGAVSCKAVLPPDEYAGHDQCVCYSINAKNSFGGYAGSQLYAAAYIGDSRWYIVIPVASIDPPASDSECSRARMTIRPASKIAERVPK